MLRIYQAPRTTPGQTTLQADEGTWAALIERLKQGGKTADADTLLTAFRAAEIRAPRGRAQIGQGPHQRVTVPDALARTILDSRTP